MDAIQEYEVFYPNVYNRFDAAVLSAHKAKWDACAANTDLSQEIANRTLDHDRPGVSGRVLEVTDWETKLFAQNFDPDNPIYFDDTYAKEHGYDSKPAMPTFGAFDGAWFDAMPKSLSDSFFVSGLTHRFNFKKPIYPGDKLYFVATKRTFEDITPPEGSIFRTFSIYGGGDIYNQNGEIVASGWSRVKESLLRHKNSEKQTPEGPSDRENPDWWGHRPAHYYTDADWEKIQQLWNAEQVRGDEKLYWEDVHVGDRPPVTADGPIVAQDLWNWHSVGSAHGTYLRDVMGPIPSPFKPALARDEKTGLYTCTGFNHTSDGINSDFRAGFFNFVGPYLCMRTLSNWIGHHGKIRGIGWNIMQTVAGHPEIPDYPDGCPGWINQVPGFEDFKLTTHGLQNDLAITNLYVTKKYVEYSNHLVDLVWWTETVDGAIWEQGSATVELPARSAAIP